MDLGFQISESNGYGGISHGGTETITMRDGNVGIGAGANPENPLHIVSDVGDAVKIDRAGGVNLVLRNTAVGTGFQITNGGLFGQISHGGSPTIWLKDGNVGVGVEPAVEKLEVSGAVTVADSAAADSAEGTVRYSGGDFQGRTGAGWQSLTSGAVETVHTGIAWDDTSSVTDLGDAMYLNASYVGVDFTGAAAAGDNHTVQLPDTVATGARLGRRIYIKDETPGGFQTASGGFAGFEVSSGGAELEGLVGTAELTEDNQSFLVMCVDDGSVTGTAKWFIV